MNVAEILGLSPMDLVDKKETSKEPEKSLATLDLSKVSNVPRCSSHPAFVALHMFSVMFTYVL